MYMRIYTYTYIHTYIHISFSGVHEAHHATLEEEEKMARCVCVCVCVGMFSHICV